MREKYGLKREPVPEPNPFDAAVSESEEKKASKSFGGSIKGMFFSDKTRANSANSESTNPFDATENPEKSENKKPEKSNFDPIKNIFI